MLSINSVEKHTKDFWKYASQTRGVLEIKDAFMDWAKDANIDLKAFQIIYASVNYDVNNAFDLRSAKMPKKEFLQQLMGKLFEQSKNQQELTNFYNKYLFGEKEEEEELFGDSVIEDTPQNEMPSSPSPISPIENSMGTDSINAIEDTTSPNIEGSPSLDSQEPDLASSMNELIKFK